MPLNVRNYLLLLHSREQIYGGGRMGEIRGRMAEC
jgi:hypothetical protein